MSIQQRCFSSLFFLLLLGEYVDTRKLGKIKSRCDKVYAPFSPPAPVLIDLALSPKPLLPVPKTWGFSRPRAWVACGLYEFSIFFFHVRVVSFSFDRPNKKTPHHKTPHCSNFSMSDFPRCPANPHLSPGLPK